MYPLRKTNPETVATEPVSKLLTTAEAAELADVSVRTIQYAVRSGGISVVRVGRLVRFLPEDVELYRAARRPALDTGLFLYVIGPVGRDSPVKVGATKGLRRRLSWIQVGNPEELEVKLSLYCPTAAVGTELERRIQHILRKNHIRGEWFDTEVELVRPILESLGNEKVSASERRF